MDIISYRSVKPEDTELISLIADWYLGEWNISKEATIQRFSDFNIGQIAFQIVMYLNDTPIATGGVYHHVGLLNHEPRFKLYNPWLALVFTIKANRGKGYGALLCKKIQEVSQALKFEQLFLFTDTAESLYKRLDWKELERIDLKGRNIVIMNKCL
jgi:GNAT superfamily N-acetyltransferase